MAAVEAVLKDLKAKNSGQFPKSWQENLFTKWKRKYLKDFVITRKCTVPIGTLIQIMKHFLKFHFALKINFLFLMCSLFRGVQSNMV